VDVRLEVPVSASESVRSRIYSFISRMAERTDGDDRYCSITITPTGQDDLYHLKFSSPEAGTAFVDYLRTMVGGGTSTPIHTTL
jgi:hypothetical protein